MGPTTTPRYPPQCLEICGFVEKEEEKIAPPAVRMTYSLASCRRIHAWQSREYRSTSHRCSQARHSPRGRGSCLARLYASWCRSPAIHRPSGIHPPPNSAQCDNQAGKQPVVILPCSPGSVVYTVACPVLLTQSILLQSTSEVRMCMPYHILQTIWEVAKTAPMRMKSIVDGKDLLAHTSYSPINVNGTECDSVSCTTLHTGLKPLVLVCTSVHQLHYTTRRSEATTVEIGSYDLAYNDRLSLATQFCCPSTHK